MEDILASIRRILNEEDAKPAEAEAGEPIPPHKAGEPDVLELDDTMMLPDQSAADRRSDPVRAAPSSYEQPVAEPTSTAKPPPERPAPPAAMNPAPPVAMNPAPPAATNPAPSSVAGLSVPFPLSGQSLVAPEAAAAASVSIGALMRTLASERSTQVHRGGPTIEDLVRDEIRPLLKQWLDEHLPPLVERLVRTEIERVMSRMT